MGKLIALFLLMQWQLGPYVEQVKPDDPRPPYVTVKLALYEVTALTTAEADVALKEAELQLAKDQLAVLQEKTINAHKLKDAPDYVMCGKLGYHGHIERTFVVWTLEATECRAL